MAAADGAETAGEQRLRPPSLFMMLAEVRSIFELNSSVLLSPLLLRAPKGDGHPVLALPGFLARGRSGAPTMSDVVAGFALTRHFLEARVLAPHDQTLPEPCIRLADLVARDVPVAV